jgi:hypothetical protein
MPLPIRYTATNVSNSVRLGNIALGVNAVDYGPSTTSGWAAGVSIPSDGYDGEYAIYYLSGTNLRIRKADTFTLTAVAGQIMGTTYASNAAALSGLAAAGYAVTSTVVPPNIVTSGSVFNVDASLIMSYPRTNSVWYDISGNAINGTLINGPTFNSTNNSLAFDGTDDNVSTSYNSAVAFLNTSPYTLEVLVNAQSQINYPGFMNRESNVGLGRDGYNLIYTLVGQSAGQVFVFSERFTTGTSTFAGFTTATSSFFNNWHHVLSTYDGSMVRIYYDGVLQGSGSSTGNITNASKALEIANRNGAVLKGNLSYARVYNRALSQSEILQNYYQGNIVTDGLVFAEDAANLVSYPATGTSTYNLAGSRATGTLTNGTGFNGVNGGVFSFDGTNDYIVFPNDTNLDSQTITMESWSNINSLFQNGFLFEKGQVNSQYSNFYNSDGTFYFRTMGLSSQDLTFYIPSYITINTWNHIVCTYGNGVKTIYLNGVQIAQATGLTGTISTDSTGLYMGAYGPGVGYFLNGKIAISRVYNKALTISEVQQNFNAQRNRYNL